MKTLESQISVLVERVDELVRKLEQKVLKEEALEKRVTKLENTKIYMAGAVAGATFIAIASLNLFKWIGLVISALIHSVKNP